MNSIATPDAIKKISQGLKGPIIVQVSLPEVILKQNRRLANENMKQLFLQLQDDQSKLTAYLCDDAFKWIHSKLADGDFLEILKYEVKEVKPGQKVVKITAANLLENPNEIEETSNSLDNLAFDRVLMPSREDKTPNKNEGSKIQPQFSKSAPFGRSFQAYIDSLNKPNERENHKLTPPQNNQFSLNSTPNKGSPSSITKNGITRSPFSASKILKENLDNQTKFKNLNPSPGRSNNDDDGIYTPISHLQLNDEQWMIKVRVYSKGNKIPFKRRDGSENQLFTINMLDNTSAEISATFFDNACVEKYYDLIEVDKVYAISGGSIKQNTKKIGKSQNPLQIVFDARSPIYMTEVDNDRRIPYNLYNFQKILNIYKEPAESLIDVVGLVAKVGEIESVNIRDRMASIRKIEIVDAGLKPIEATLWDSRTALNVKPYDLIMISPAKIKEFSNVKSLTIPSQSEVVLNNLPDCPAVRELCEWVSTANAKQIVTSINIALLEEHLKMISEIQEGPLEENQIFWINAHVTYIYDTKMSFVCPQCKRRIENDKDNTVNKSSNYNEGETFQDGNAQCSKCNNAFQSPVKRSTVRVKLADATGSLDATAFGITAEKLLNKNADPGLASQMMENVKGFDGQVYQEYKFKIKSENFMGQKKFLILTFFPLNYTDESQDLLSRLDVYKAMVPKVINSLYDLF